MSLWGRSSCGLVKRVVIRAENASRRLGGADVVFGITHVFSETSFRVWRDYSENSGAFVLEQRLGKKCRPCRQEAAVSIYDPVKFVSH